jgi:two-component system OmpR family sensor kinase
VNLRTKIVALVLGVTAVVLLGVGMVLARSFQGWSAEAGDRELLQRAEAIARLVEVEDEDGLRLEEEEHAGALRDPGHPWRVVGPGGVVLEAPSDLEWPSRGLDAERPEMRTVTAGGGRSWRVASAAFDVAGDHGTTRIGVQVAGSVAPYRALEGPFRRGLLLSLAGALLLGGLGAALLAHLSLAPLRRLAADIAATGLTSLDRGVRLDGLDPELRRVAGAFNELLERLDSAMQQQRQLVARASHALRTPVATIRTRAEVSLRRERDPVAYRAALAEIEIAARDATALIAQLLTLARLDERRGPIEMEDVQVGSLTAEVMHVLAPRAEEAGVSLEVEVDAGHAVRGNRAALRELLEALLDNAVRYTPSGGRAGIATRLAGGRCDLRVWDTGPGIPEQERPRVVDRFFRGSAGLASAQPGSGLGLAVVKAIAEAHRAALVFAERPGGGLEVTVSLQRAG